MKTDFSIKDHFKVIQSQSLESGKSIRYFMRPQINIGFNSKGSEDKPTEITRNRWFWLPHCRLRLLHHGNTTNSRMNLIPAESRVSGLHFCRWQYGSIFFHISTVSSERRIICALSVRYGGSVIEGRWFWDQLTVKYIRTSYYRPVLTFAPCRTVSGIRRLIGWKSQISLPLSVIFLSGMENYRTVDEQCEGMRCEKHNLV